MTSPFAITMEGCAQIQSAAPTVLTEKVSLSLENKSPELAIKKQEDHHITFKVNNNTLSFRGKPVRFFKTPGSIDDLYGTWHAHSFTEGGKRGDFVSADLAGWNIPQKGRDKYFQNRNRRIRDYDYSLDIFIRSEGNLSNPSSGYGGGFLPGVLSV